MASTSASKTSSGDDLAGSVWVVIPAFNEAGRVEAVVSSLRNQGLHCLVIDDGSADDTGIRAEMAGADEVIRHEINRGYECAIDTGLKALAERDDCVWVVSLDGDGQIEPAEVLPLVQAADNAGAGIGCGVRDRPARWSERLAALLLCPLTGIRDPMCGLKVYRADIVRRHPKARGRRIGMELAVRAMRAGSRIVHRRIHTLPRQGSVSRFGSGLATELAICRAVLALLLVALFGGQR